MKLYISLFLVACSVFLFGSCSSFVDNESAMALVDSKSDSNLRVSKLKVDVSIHGRVVETTMLVTFRNHTSRILEAKLDLPLPEGASISGYYLDVNGKMRKGVLVDKKLGRVAFDNIIRRRVDPGLLEKTEGNNFRTRIYPVPAKGTKTFSISYIQPLQNVKLSLPLALKDKVDLFELNMIHSNGSVVSDGGLFTSTNKVEFKRSNYRPHSLQFSIHGNTRTDAYVTTVKSGVKYFYVADEYSQKTKARRLPKNMQLIWDASHSGLDRDLEAELELLKQYLASLKSTTVELKILRNTLLSAGEYKIENGDSSALVAKIKSFPFDGSTALDRARFNSSKYDITMLFSDGRNSTGEFNLSAGKHPIFVVNSSSKANYAVLNHLAKVSNGAVVDPIEPSAWKVLRFQSLKLIKVTGTGVRDAQIQTFSDYSQATGIASSATKSLNLHYGWQNQIVETKRVKVSNNFLKSKATSMLWAQQKIDALSVRPQKNRSKIVKLSQKHDVVSDFTSLIVLDEISDYVAYRIVPPEAKQRKEYYRLIKEVDKFELQANANLNEIYFDWENLKRWHQGKDKQYRQFVFNTPTGGLRSGDTAITRDSINFFLSNPNRTSTTGNSMFLGGGNSMFLGGGNIGGGTKRTAADFVGGQIFSTPTAGLRSGDTAITRDSINFFLANPSAPNFKPYKLLDAHSLSDGKKLKSDGRYDRYGKTAQVRIAPEVVSHAYFKSLSRGKNYSERMAIYLRWKKRHGDKVGFYLHSSKLFAEHGHHITATRILSNIAELDTESAENLRVLAYRYMQLGKHQLAVKYFRRVKEMRGEEPQSYRDLALALERVGRYQEASNMYWTVVKRSWNWRFNGIELVVLNEWNRLIHKHRSSIKLSKSQKRFIYNVQTDMRVVISWDTDNTNIDLNIIDPKGKKCSRWSGYYGWDDEYVGVFSKDMSQGRGPEEFLLKKALKGTYKVEVSYPETREQTLIGDSTVQVTLIYNWGRPNEVHKHQTIQLKALSEGVKVGEFVWK